MAGSAENKPSILKGSSIFEDKGWQEVPGVTFDTHRGLPYTDLHVMFPVEAAIASAIPRWIEATLLPAIEEAMKNVSDENMAAVTKFVNNLNKIIAESIQSTKK